MGSKNRGLARFADSGILARLAVQALPFFPPESAGRACDFPVFFNRGVGQAAGGFHQQDPLLLADTREVRGIKTDRFEHLEKIPEVFG